MKYFVILILCFNSFLLSQDFNEDYELLAKYSILKYLIEKGFQSAEADSVFLRESIESIQNIISKEDYRYVVDTINEFRNFQFISIVDKTNLQLHCYNFTVFAIDKTADLGTRYYELNENSFLKFINDKLYEENKIKDRNHLIDIYNSLYTYFNRCVGEIIFYDEKYKSEFEYLEGIFNFNDLNRTSDFSQYLYCIKSENGSIVEYYHILYFFDCNGLHVENFLLYKIRV